MAAADDVVDDSAHHRLLVVQDGTEAELVYRRTGRRLLLLHTGVPEALSGHGVGGRLVRAVVDRARAEGLTLVPYCPFAAEWLIGHPGEVADVPVDWPAGGDGKGQDHG